VAAVALWRRGQASRAVAVLAVVVFLATFVQAAIGGYDSLYVHVPGAMLLTAGVVWLLLASLRTSAP
jgi:heme A synthase